MEIYWRLKLNVDLCEELDINIYSFPMKYHPIEDPKYFSNRDYIGKHWNRKFIRTIQAILNTTKGKDGKGKKFFEKAFGKDEEEYKYGKNDLSKPFCMGVFSAWCTCMAGYSGRRAYSYALGLQCTPERWKEYRAFKDFKSISGK